MRILLLALLVSANLSAQMLYVANNGDATISAFVIDQDSGLLTELQPRAAVPGNPTSIAIHPNKKLVYSTNSGSGSSGPTLTAFTIDSNSGALKPAGTLPLTAGSNPQGAVIDSSGKFAFVASQGANSISAFALDAISGLPTAVPGSPFASPQGPNSLVVHPSGKFLFASATGASQIAAFNIGANGALTPVTGSPFAARGNLFWTAMDPAGKFLFAVERQDNAVLVYSVNVTTGALTQVGNPYPAGQGVSGVAVDPAGKYVYVSNAFNGSATVFSIGATGALAQIPNGNFPTILGAYSPILDPTGNYLYVTGQTAGLIRQFSINPATGGLNPIGDFIPAGNQPTRGATVLLSPPVLPPINAISAFNSFSVALTGLPNAGVAQGSRVTVTGTNIGPPNTITTANSPGDFPLQTQLGGVTLQIQSADGTVTAGIPLVVTTGLVSALVPSTTPLGDAKVTVTYKGRTTNPLPVSIVAIAPGIATANGAGNGPAGYAVVVTDPTNIVPVIPNPSNNALNLPVMQGQMMVLGATGLGAASFDETQALSQTIATPVDVIVGNKVVAATTILRDFHAPGADGVLFQVPADAPDGCYVPIALRANGIVSNVASITISSSGSTCSDPAGLAAADTDAAEKAGQLNFGSLLLSRTDFSPITINDSISASFGTYDKQALLRSVAPTAGQGIRSGVSLPPFGMCTISPGNAYSPDHIFDLTSDPTQSQFLNPGQTLNINGPAGKAQLTPPDYSLNPDKPILIPGDYTIDNGTGVKGGVGPFKAVLTLPSPVTWTSKDSIVKADRTQDLTVTWSGGKADKEYVMIFGVSGDGRVIRGFFCAESASAGQFTIPAWVLAQLPVTGTFSNGGQTLPNGLLGIGTASLASAGLFSATGLDFASFTYEQALVSLLPYQ